MRLACIKTIAFVLGGERYYTHRLVTFQLIDGRARLERRILIRPRYTDWQAHGPAPTAIEED